MFVCFCLSRAELSLIPSYGVFFPFASSPDPHEASQNVRAGRVLGKALGAGSGSTAATEAQRTGVTCPASPSRGPRTQPPWGLHTSTSLLWVPSFTQLNTLRQSPLPAPVAPHPPIKQEVRAFERAPRLSGPGSGHLAARGLRERLPRRRPRRPVSAPGSGGAAPAAPRQARGGQVQVAAQEGGGGGAARPRPHLLSPARCAECWDRSIGVVCVCKHR